MALNETEQFTEIIKQSHHILITFKKDFSVDAVASALALYLILNKMGKLIDIACDDFELPKNLKFLTNSAEIKTELSNLQKFVISIATKDDNIDNFSYNIKDRQLKIYITPKSGAFSQKDVSAQNSEYKYDLIITVDTPDLDSLGKIYQNFTDFFYNTNIVNIDNKSDNEHFGQINLTNFNSTSTTEILFDLINEIDKELFDPEIATCLLAGMISKTKSFKTSNVTPRTLDIAGRLINMEADREAIIKSLYRSRSLSTLNLWGRVLARLKSDGDNRLIWSMITEHDFVEAGADKKDMPDVIEELISFIPTAEIIVLIYQQGEKSCVMLNTFKNHNALYLTKDFKPVGSKNSANFCLIGKSLLETEQEVIENIKKNLSPKQ